MISIAIDGPAGAGKSTVSRILAKKLNFLYFDTGALYRTVAYHFLVNNIDFHIIDLLKKELKTIKIDFKIENNIQKLFLCGEDVTDKIRTEKISMLASEISAILEVREFLLGTQRDLAHKNNVIMDGRDIGTVVLPDADIKIFLTASLEVRVERRYKELLNRGFDTNYESVLNDIKKRDFDDSNRKVAPLTPAKDSIILNTTNYSLDEVVSQLIKIYKEKFNTKS